MLTLILQTLEGQQIELNVQPEDTFADLKIQYSDADGLSESLERLITNGAAVEESTRIFDYVTSSAHEWFSTGEMQESDAQSSEAADPRTRVKECCAQGCSNSEAVTPGKPFFPLPTDDERLTECLTEAGRPDLCSHALGLDPASYQKYFLCGNNFAEDSLPPARAVEPMPTMSVLKPKNVRIRSDIASEPENDLLEVDSETRDSLVDPTRTPDNFEHPGVLCRLCGETTENPVHLYAEKGENSEYSLADKINLCLPVTVSVTDSLPKQICRECQIKLNTCHELALSSLRTEDKLILLLRENKLCANGAFEHQCPLCLEGAMRMVKRSGIYRKEDLQNDLTFSKERKPTRGSIEIEVDSKNEDNVISESVSLPVPEEFPSSVCDERLIGVTAIRSHRCPTDAKHSPYNCHICDEKDFAHSHELELHYRRHGMKEKFFCELCGYTCGQLDEVNEHIKACRPEFWQFHREAFGKALPNGESPNDHDCHGASPDPRDSEVKFSCEPEALKSSAKKRQPTRYSCHFCEKRFARKGSLQKHLSTAHNDTMDDPAASKCYKCRGCNEAFAKEGDVATHIKIRHLDDSQSELEYAIDELSVASLYICEYCERCFTTPSSLHDHREVEHDKISCYSCPTCLEMFDSHKRLAAHKSLRSHRKPLDYLNLKQLYLCRYCDKTFLHHSTLTTHELQHRDLAPYLCRPCGLSFETYREVASHRDVVHPYQSELHESSSRSYKCQYCGKLFSHEFVLVKHIRMHTGERPHKCSVCGKGFSQSSGLYTHMKIHSDLRPYNCPSCPRTFKIKGDRNNHVKKHSGNRPYKCEFCSKAFMTQHVYSQHRRIHTNERPYKCEICGEAFRRSYVRTVHMRRHTGEKPHLCDLCPKTYRQRSDLVKHRKVQHGISVVANSEIVFPNEREDDSNDSYAKANEIVETAAGNSLLLGI